MDATLEMLTTISNTTSYKAYDVNEGKWMPHWKCLRPFPTQHHTNSIVQLLEHNGELYLFWNVNMVEMLIIVLRNLRVFSQMRM